MQEEEEATAIIRYCNYNICKYLKVRHKILFFHFKSFIYLKVSLFFILKEVYLTYNIVISSLVQQRDSIIHVHTSTLCDFFPIRIITEYQVEFPALYSMSLLANHSIYRSVPTSISNPNPSLAPIFPFGNHVFVLLRVFHKVDEVRSSTA